MITSRKKQKRGNNKEINKELDTSIVHPECTIMFVIEVLQFKYYYPAPLWYTPSLNTNVTNRNHADAHLDSQIDPYTGCPNKNY